jgi:hypothetical protein
VARILVLFAALALVVAGCGGSDSGSDEGPAQTASGCQPLVGGTTDPTSFKGPEETLFLTDVRVEGRDCTDRVTFGFRDDATAPPGYDIKYAATSQGVFEDTAGNPIEVAGQAFLIVALTPVMTADVSGGSTDKTYTGPNRIKGEGTSSVQEVVKTDDFESVVTWVIGLDREQPYAAKATKTQLVIDIQNP